MLRLLIAFLLFLALSFIQAQEELEYVIPAINKETKALVAVGTSGPSAVKSGLETLQQGGNALDAALVIALKQIALDFGCWNSYAGILNLVYFDAKSQKIYNLNANYKVPSKELNPLTIPTQPTPSGRTVLVPGFMAGVEAAHKRFGSLPFAALFQPAIEVAENGILINTRMASLLRSKQKTLCRIPETAALFTKENGMLYQKGELLKQPLLAKTLRAVASQGASYMYTGEWGEALVKRAQAEGGELTLKDLADYQVLWPPPYQTTYQGLEVYAAGFPSIGGLHIIEALNLLEFVQPQKFGHYLQSSKALYWLIQVSRIGPLCSMFSDYSLSYMQQFLPQAPFKAEIRITKKQAQKIWDKLKEPGWIQKFQGLPAPKKSGHSDGVITMDQEGNIAVLTHTINTSAWGTTGIFVQGVSIPDSAAFQQMRIYKSPLKERVPNEMTPLLILQAGKPIIASSTIGGGLHEATLQALHNIIDFKMNAKVAAKTPIFLGPDWKMKSGLSQYHKQGIGKGEFSLEVVEKVRKLGQPLTVKLPAEQSDLRGFWIGLTINPETGIVQSGVSPWLVWLAKRK